MNTNFAWAADDDRLAELEKKIEVMQAAYESKIDSLESRIEELEGEKAKASAKKQVQTPPPRRSVVCGRLYGSNPFGNG